MSFETMAAMAFTTKLRPGKIMTSEFPDGGVRDYFLFAAPRNAAVESEYSRRIDASILAIYNERQERARRAHDYVQSSSMLVASESLHARRQDALKALSIGG